MAMVTTRTSMTAKAMQAQTPHCSPTNVAAIMRSAQRGTQVETNWCPDGVIIRVQGGLRWRPTGVLVVSSSVCRGGGLRWRPTGVLMVSSSVCRSGDEMDYWFCQTPDSLALEGIRRDQYLESWVVSKRDSAKAEALIRSQTF